MKTNCTLSEKKKSLIDVFMRGKFILIKWVRSAKTWTLIYLLCAHFLQFWLYNLKNFTKTREINIKKTSIILPYKRRKGNPENWKQSDGTDVVMLVINSMAQVIQFSILYIHFQLMLYRKTWFLWFLSFFLMIYIPNN